MALRARVALPIVAMTLMITGCSGAGPDSMGSTEPSAERVTVRSDVRFAAAAPDAARWSDPLLDVYALPGAHDLPLVVWFPPHGLTKDDSPSYAQLATAVAERGAVVVVANWSQLEDAATTFTDPSALRRVSAAGQSVAGCAVSFAVAHADDYGADPSRLVIGGELFGANVASMVALGEPEPLPACEASAGWRATGLVGLNDDWLVLYPVFDEVAAAAFRSQSPWGLLHEAPRMPVATVVTSAAIAVGGRCGDRDARWMVSRDPTGAVRARLDQAAAYDDGCVDMADEAAAMSAEMTSRGLPATVVRLSNSDGGTRSDAGAHVEQYGPADLVGLTDTVSGLAR